MGSFLPSSSFDQNRLPIRLRMPSLRGVRRKPTVRQAYPVSVRHHTERATQGAQILGCHSPPLVLPKGRPDRNWYLATPTRSVSSLDHTLPGYAFKTFTRRLPPFYRAPLQQELTNSRTPSIGTTTTKPKLRGASHPLAKLPLRRLGLWDSLSCRVRRLSMRSP